MTGSQTPQNTNPAPKMTARDAMNRGLLNVALDRWAPKTQPARILFEFGILIPVFLVLAILLKLSQG